MRVLTPSAFVSSLMLFGVAESSGDVVEKIKFGHEALNIIARQFLPAVASPKTTTTARVLTYVTPSPSAAPIPITKQYQKITSYVPIIALCALGPIAQVTGIFPNLNPTRTFPPFYNVSRIVPTGPGTCLTKYQPTLTPICHTVLRGLASKVTVTDCTQEVTFSKDTGFELVTTPAVLRRALSTPSPSAYIQTVNTYYVAPWDELTTPGVAPSEVEQKICRNHPNGTEICVGNVQRWQVSTVTKIRTITSVIDLTTTVRGPAEVMIETWHATVTGKETLLSLSTNLAVTYGFETETTIRSNMTATKTETDINTWTRQLGYNTMKPTSKTKYTPMQLPSDLPSAWFPIINVPEET